MTNPNEPTLTCSEVVERLAKDVADELLHKWPSSILSDEQVKKHIAEIVCMHATQRLHSWRERRVQELEECLRETAARLAATNVAIGQGLGEMEDGCRVLDEGLSSQQGSDRRPSAFMPGMSGESRSGRARSMSDWKLKMRPLFRRGTWKPIATRTARNYSEPSFAICGQARRCGLG
jgi:hypothetical protein